MDPIQHLLDEHQVIMGEFADLRAAVGDLKARGDAALPQALPVLGRIGRLMETQLARHAQKEDDGLFPALEDIFGMEGTPTYVMRLEHKDIHAQGALLRQTLHELNAVEHPQIVAGGAELRALAEAAGGDAATIVETCEEIIRLLDLHFGKEEEILFPMARNMLDEDTLERVGRTMEALSL